MNHTGPEHCPFHSKSWAHRPIRFFLGYGILLASLAHGFSSGAIQVQGIRDGEVLNSPVTPLITVPDGFEFQVTLNGSPHDGEAITGQGLHKLEITATGPYSKSHSLVKEFIVITEGQRAPPHTIPMEHLHIRQVRMSPHAKPTKSADDFFVLGWTKGWPSDPAIPPHPIPGYRITDFSIPDQNKARIVLTDGNHPREHTGSWGLRGMVDFLISGEPEAETLRRLAVFFVYPTVNPDGRFVGENRNNPELAAEGVSDHNRVWNTSGRFTTIDILTEAMRRDTGGKADFLLDFHSAGSTFFYSLPDMMDTPLARAITARDPVVRPRSSSGHPGMLRIWAMSGEGLSAAVAYTPEFGSGETARRSMEIGRNYGLAFHDLLTGQSLLAELEELIGSGHAGGPGQNQHRRLREVKSRWEQIMRQGENTRAVLAAMEPVCAAMRTYREYLSQTQLANDLLAAARPILSFPEEGFGLLFREAIRRGTIKLVDILADDRADLPALESAADFLSQAVADYWKIQEAAPFPEALPREIGGVYSIRSDDDWKEGFLVNLAVEDGKLFPSKTMVLDFNGDGDHVMTGFYPDETKLGQRFTWEFWKYYRSFDSNAGSSGSGGEEPRFYTQIDDSGGTLRTGMGDAYWASATLAETDRWHHVAIVFNEGEVRTFVDGDLASVREGVSFSGRNDQPFAIGRGFRGARWLEGRSREHRVWSTARSDAEIRLNRHRRLSGTEEGLIAYWKLNEGMGNRIHDHAGGRYPGEIHGASWRQEVKPGFWLSRPLLFTEVQSFNNSRVFWESSSDSGDGQVAVWLGMGESVTALPSEWHRVQNGERLAFLQNVRDFSGKGFWIKVEVSPDENLPPVEIRQLTLRIE